MGNMLGYDGSRQMEVNCISSASEETISKGQMLRDPKSYQVLDIVVFGKCIY
jgi:hypothetical protein